MEKVQKMNMDDMNPVIRKMMEMASIMMTPETAEYGRNFKTRSSDIMVTTYPKCGTTWMLQICHQLRSGGHMDFRDMTEVAPWDIMAKSMKQDLNADQLFEPRVFKSHETCGLVAKGAKYILVTRDPHDAFVSGYKFMLNSSNSTPADCSIDEFAKMENPSGSFAQYQSEWYNAWKKKEAEILWVSYEDLKSDPDTQIRRVAVFMGIGKEILEERVQTAIKMSSMEFMKEHQAKFADEVILEVIQDAKAVGVTSAMAKINEGKLGAGNDLPAWIIEKFDKEWETYIGKPLGFKTYAEFREAVKE